jgi:hypothetical protein
MAGVVMDDAVHTIYLDLAAQWRDLARQVEMWEMDREKLEPSSSDQRFEASPRSDGGGVGVFPIFNSAITKISQD